MPSPGVRPSGGPGGDGRSGGQSSPGTCSIASSLSGTRALRSASNAGAEARDDLLGSDYPPSSSSAAAVMAAEEAAMAAAGSGSCGIGLPSMIKDNLVMSAAASAASSGSGKGQVSSWTAATANGNSSSSNSSSRANDGKSSTSNKDVSNGIGDGGQSPRSRAQEEEVVEEEGLFDWVGSSIQSACDTAYDNICFPTNKEESNANNGNAESNGGGAPPPLAAQTQTQTQEDGLPHSSSSATSSGLLGNYLKSGAKSPVSFATSGSTANDMLPAGEDDSSPVRASKTNRGYRRAQTAPPPTSTSSMDHADSPSARRRGSDTSGGGGGTLQPAASMDSIDSRGRRRSSVKSRVAASLKTSRSRSDNNMAGEGTAPSPPKAASFDAAAAGSRDEQDSLGSGLRLSSLRPPLGPRLGTSWGGKKEGGGTDGGTMSWTMMHDKLIDELFEASRRQYIATHFGGGEGGQKGHHHLHDQPKEKEQKKEHSGWKLGKLLPGGGGGNDAEVVGAKSMKKKRRKRKRPKILRRKKKKEEAAAAAAAAPKTGTIGASVTSALAAATAIATGGASSAKEESVTSPRPAKGKQSKVSSDPSPATEANTSSSFLPRVGRFSPSKKKSSDNSLPDVHRSVSFAKGTAGPKRSIIRATGEYTGRQNPDPGTFLHPKCRLQKDKGRGEIPGNAICVVSREKALKKLRQKVDVIIEVEQSSTASTKAKLKLKQAVLIARAGADDDMIETRSIISVKMGFLSMKYGILLRWDAETGLVHLIVLRKMCPTGFLAGDNGNAAITTDAAKASNGASARAMPSPAVPQSSGQAKKSPSKRPKKSIKDSSSSKLILGRFVDGANAILHGKGWESDASAVGTEVAHLGAPYLVQRPESFADATLSVTVLRAEDLCAGDSRGSDWVMNPYVRLSIGAQTHRTRALKMTTSPTWNDTCRLAVSNNPRDDDQHLKVEVYDWRLMRRDRILGVVFVPVASIEPQKSSRNGAEPVSTEVTIPVRMMRNKKGPYGYVTLSLVHQNDHLCWLKEELKARGRD